MLRLLVGLGSIAASITINIPAFELFFISAGGGHGDYLWDKILFPLPRWVVANYRNLEYLWFVIRAVQFPIYGLIFALASAKGWKWHFITCVTLLAFHVTAVAMYFVH
jgi:hypothetical protein